jgi:hypothetical protein
MEPPWGIRPPPISTSPHLTSPHLTSPHLTSPHLTSPRLGLPQPFASFHSSILSANPVCKVRGADRHKTEPSRADHDHFERSATRTRRFFVETARERTKILVIESPRCPPSDGAKPVRHANE